MNSTSNPGTRTASSVRMTSSSWQTARHFIGCRSARRHGRRIDQTAIIRLATPCRGVHGFLDGRRPSPPAGSALGARFMLTRAFRRVPGDAGRSSGDRRRSRRGHWPWPVPDVDGGTCRPIGSGAVHVPRGLQRASLRSVRCGGLARAAGPGEAAPAALPCWRGVGTAQPVFRSRRRPRPLRRHRGGPEGHARRRT